MAYRLTRTLIVRLLGVIYFFAFLGILRQGLPLLGHYGLTPIDAYVANLHAGGVTFWDVPSLFMFDASDLAIIVYAVLGVAIALCLVLGYANLPMLLVLWALYGSFERLGQTWFSFGWEMQILETTLLVAAMSHPWDPRPREPSQLSIVLMRWLAFRIMLGAGLIKWRGDPCWRELTCLDTHFETQPLPNPLSPWFHHAPHAVHVVGVVFNHVVELIAPWFAFGPRLARRIAGCAMLAFQLTLIASGNLAFLNWLTMVPLIACLDDDFVARLVPKRWRPAVGQGEPVAWVPLVVAGLASAFVVITWKLLWSWLPAGGQLVWGVALLAGALSYAHRRGWRQIWVALFAGLVAVKSLDVVANLASKHQAMNRSYDALALVNTYGAFGSVGKTRYELIFEGTLAEEPDANAVWKPYEFPCKPGDVDRAPCVLGPYHRRLDWLIWFAAMSDTPRDAWVLHFIYKLLAGDAGIRRLVDDPFDGTAPRWVRVRRFVYTFGDDTWWTRSHEQLWLPPIEVDDPELLRVLAQFNWPSPVR